MVILFNEKKNCCGCSACMNICPTKAIRMSEDENGFIYPIINNHLCINCGLCLKVCSFQNVPVSGEKPIATYAAINKNEKVLLSSSSGGVFSALSALIFERNGVVFGSAYNENLEPEHVCLDNLTDIKKLQSSKYAQSRIGVTYTETKRYLDNDRWVLFTGTPCQIAGLKSFLGKNYNRLITADLVCHGVPSSEFFKGYIKYLENKFGGKVINFNFRDKSKGWSILGKVVYEKRNKLFKETIIPIESYYYNYFLKGEIYRDSCYECKYACASREGDFTIGDYWGIEKAHKYIETKNGVSLLLVNNKRGMVLLNELSRYISLYLSDFEKARKNNQQLNNPVKKSEKREKILKTWRQGGYQAVADLYYKENKNALIVSRFKKLIPTKIKVFIKRLFLGNLYYSRR